MINDFFLLAVMAGILFWIDKRLAVATLAVLPFILVVTYFFRKFVRDANRKIRTAVARINSFLQEYISGMGVVQLFNREQKARAEFGRRNRDNMLAWRDAILAFALFYPAVEILSVSTIALLVLVRWQSRAEWHAEPRRADCIHDVRHALFPADSGSEREIQHPAVRDGGFGAHLQVAG